PAAPIITESGSTMISTVSTNYQWSLNGKPITGATVDSLKPLQAGDYTVTIIDQNGCSNISKPFTFTDSGQTTIAVPLMTTANPADNVKLPIELLRSQRLAQSGAMHYTAKLRFNKTLLAPSGATPTGVIVGNDLIVTISGTNPLPLGTTSGTLATLDFLATLGNDTCTDVSIDEFIWTDGTVRVTRQNGRFCLTGVCEAGGKIRLIDPNAKLSLGQSHPNPAQTQTTVDYDLDEQGETELFITDIVGKEVRRIAQGVQIPGHYSAIINLEGMAQGVYICVLKTPSAKLSHLMQISR
ncbi:MAG: T9SS type A sorting domain-containing protein, partial [Candidatus Kapaibacterium sp.]